MRVRGVWAICGGGGAILVGVGCSILSDPSDLVGAPSTVDGSVDPLKDASNDSSNEMHDGGTEEADATTDASTDANTFPSPTTLVAAEPGVTSLAAIGTSDLSWLNTAANARTLHATNIDGGLFPQDAGSGYTPEAVFPSKTGVAVFGPSAVRSPDQYSPCITYNQVFGAPNLTCGLYDPLGRYTSAAIDDVGESIFLLVDQCNATTSCLFYQSATSKTTAYGNTVWRGDAGTGGAMTAPGPLAYDPNTSRVFFFTLDGAGMRTLWSVPAKAVQAEATLIASDSAPPRAMAVDSESVYWVTTDGHVKRTRKNADAGAVEIVGTHTFTSPAAIALGNQNIFIADQGGGSIVALNKADGVAQVLSTGEAEPAALILTSTQIVWANKGDGKIRALPRSIAP